MTRFNKVLSNVRVFRIRGHALFHAGVSLLGGGLAEGGVFLEGGVFGLEVGLQGFESFLGLGALSVRELGGDGGAALLCFGLEGGHAFSQGAGNRGLSEAGEVCGALGFGLFLGLGFAGNKGFLLYLQFVLTCLEDVEAVAIVGLPGLGLLLGAKVGFGEAFRPVLRAVGSGESDEVTGGDALLTGGGGLGFEVGQLGSAEVPRLRLEGFGVVRRR